MTKAQQKKLVGSVAVDESLLTPASVRALMAQCADSAVAKSEVRLEQRFEAGKSAVRLASTVMVQVGEILKILNLAKFQSICENTPLFFEIFDYFFTHFRFISSLILVKNLDPKLFAGWAGNWIAALLRLAGVETSMGSLESTVTSQLKAVAQGLKSEIQQSRKGKGGDRKGKGGWSRPRWQQPQQQGWQQQSSPWGPIITTTTLSNPSRSTL